MLTVAAISLVNTAAIQVIDTLAETIDFCKPEDAINEVCSASSKHEMWASHVPAVRKTSFVAAWRQPSARIVLALQVGPPHPITEYDNAVTPPPPTT